MEVYPLILPVLNSFFENCAVLIPMRELFVEGGTSQAVGFKVLRRASPCAAEMSAGKS